jgi:hypothetical protein
LTAVENLYTLYRSGSDWILTNPPDEGAVRLGAVHEPRGGRRRLPMNTMNWLKMVMCCGVMAGVCGVAGAQPVETKPAMPAMPSKDAIKGVQPEKKDAPTAAKPPEMPADKQAEMDAWMKASTPGDMHKWLARGAGTWDAVVKMMYPGEPSSESKGTMFIDMVLGGRYQAGLFKGDMMGMPFEGIATTGYNNMTKMFESTWIDSFTTATMFSKGTLDGDKLVMKGEMIDPTNGKTIKERQVCSYTGSDKMLSEFYHEIDGKDVLVMSISYTRSAAKPAAEPKPADKSAMDQAKEEAMKKAMEEMKKAAPTGK